MTIDAGSVTENTLVSGKDGGRQMTNLVYVLYLVGFVLFPVAVVGVVLAYTGRDQATAPYSSHLQYQVSLFMKGLIFQAAIMVLYLLTSALTAVSFGLGAVTYILPIGIGIWWFVWTLIRIIRGMQALGRGVGIN
ncbi:hypothetical protein HKD27_02535 [Gluconobacter sp. R75690]|uniref:hypothetical protein n=1 Tax=unclassified Gluconobacter TaxID=2644261 RepID=UPI00188CC8AA|nr:MULTISPECIES: hypothetical protein [unclassified Gluconobacter]MBF0849801.1 hypothetical protein [Gluconobacter sp. R75690]MBF0878752.1 hypothetical protein [Gluconobacter sp. R75828]